MRKIAILLSVILLVNIVPISALATTVGPDQNVKIEENENVTIIDTVTLSGNDYVFYKEGSEYKIQYEDGSTDVWAYDVLLSSSDIGSMGISRSSEWIYIQTDRYATHLNYEVLNPFLVQADAWATLSASLGVTIAVVGYIAAYTPQAIYRVDMSYRFITDPLYWMIDSYIYKNSNYTGLIDSFTWYKQWNS